ncbi:MAG TPA: galactokinase family protein [Thermoleophilaceae bacterium]|nr:galactokinase family protein [Thermoleophilaceae bacterium]
MRHSAIRLEHGSPDGPAVQAFAPGRVNLIGEHTDYNDGVCLPFAIHLGVTVAADPLRGSEIEVHALDLGESDRFGLAGAPGHAPGWRGFVRGAAAELLREGIELRPCHLEISGDLPRGAGLSSSAALSVALCLALCAVAGSEPPPRLELARLCSRIERDWCGAETGLLDQLASLFGERGRALRIDMRGPALEPVSLELGDHVLATLDSGAGRSLAASGYNERREECRAACRALGVESLRDAHSAEGLPAPLNRRVRHVLSENERVDATVAALAASDLPGVGRLLDASHRSLRDDYEASVAAVERAIDACKESGALGARIMGGGFGGSVLALFPPGAEPPFGAVKVEPGPGATTSAAADANADPPADANPEPPV